MKKPWLAGLLNVIPGLGYLYVGVRRTFALYLVASEALMVVGFIFSPSASSGAADSTSTEASAGDFVILLAVILYFVAFIVDAHSLAQAANKNRK